MKEETPLFMLCDKIACQQVVFFLFRKGLQKLLTATGNFLV